MDRALLIIGHGSRSSDAVQIFGKTVEYIKDKSDFEMVEGAFMELASPSIEETVAKIVDNGVNDIVAVPYFLFPGIHIKEDIPEIIAALMSKHRGLKITMTEPIGYDDLICEILLKRSRSV